jgi:hypothetical protein
VLNSKSTVTVPFWTEGIDARDGGGDDATASADGSFLADGNIFGKSFGHLNFGFELAGIGNASEVGFGRDLLTDFNGNHLQDTMKTGADVQRLELAAFQS